MTHDNKFGNWVNACRQDGAGQYIQPAIEVVDTMEALHRWFQDNDIEPTAEALVAGARLVLERVDK